MEGILGIRQENKDITERRVPLTPAQIQYLTQTWSLRVIVEPAKNRIFSDEEFYKAGATISSDLSSCQIIFGIKEIPPVNLLPNHSYCFFSHTIKGQPANMPMLKRMLDLKDTLIDYEKVTDKEGRRLIFFGNYAGYAGLINTFWALGCRLKYQGISTPFNSISQTLNYASLQDARSAFREIGQQISREGLPEILVPFICGFTGYGHVSQGAQEIFDLMPHEVIAANDLASFITSRKYSRHKLYKVVFRESDMVKPRKAGARFNLREYYRHPENYTSIFTDYIPFLTVLVNGIYWEEKYPRLITKKYLKENFLKVSDQRLRVIGDITCDVNGSIECNVRTTNSANPIYTYNPGNETISDGCEGEGIIVLAEDKLPSELPVEASQTFGEYLIPYVPALSRSNYQVDFDKLRLPLEFHKAVIAHRGMLAPDYKYLTQFIKGKKL